MTPYCFVESTNVTKLTTDSIFQSKSTTERVFVYIAIIMCLVSSSLYIHCPVHSLITQATLSYKSLYVK